MAIIFLLQPDCSCKMAGGYTLTNTAGATGQVLTYNSGSAVWQPAPTGPTGAIGATGSAGLIGPTGAVGATGATGSFSNLSGDVIGAPNATSVHKIEGDSVSATTPTTGQILKWNSLAWTPTHRLWSQGMAIDW